MARRKHIQALTQRDAAALRFAAALAENLHALNITHQQVAQALGLTRYTVDYWTRLESPKLPSDENLNKLCDFLEQQRSGLGHHLASIVRGALVTLAPAVATPAIGNLRMAATSFIGREREVAEILSALEHSRLITLLGTGGIGKTRLALRLATESVITFADGVRVVELADLANPAVVVQALARALNVRGQPPVPLSKIIAQSIGNKHILIVLDNCEHLIIACADLLRELLDRCPNLHVLATSREPLAIDHEVLWRVPALALPDESAAPDRLLKYEAARLFIERAMLVQHGLTLTSNGAAITQVCRRLDGLPLAIELAAACVNELSIDQIAARLDRRFQLLTKGSPAALPRHQTLRATIDWSYDLLSSIERTVFRNLAVFAGGWTLAAAGAVCADAKLQTTLLHLVDKSLVVAEDRSGQIRYRLLDSIREYARERSIESDEIDQVRDRHLNFFVSWLTDLEPQLHGADQVSGLNHVEREIDNIRAALAWSLASNQAEAGAQLANIAEFYWYIRGYWREGINWLTQVIDQLSTQPVTHTYAVALHRLAGLMIRLGEHDRAQQLQQSSYDIYEHFNDKLSMARALSNLAVIAEEQGDLDKARSIYLRASALQRENDDRRSLAITLNNLGIVAKRRGSYEEARGFYAESLLLKRQIGEPSAICVALDNLGILARLQRDGVTARQYFEESIALNQARSDKRAYAMSLGNLGMLELQENHAAQAQQIFQEVHTIFHEMGDQNHLAMTLHNLGEAVLLLGDVPGAKDWQLQSLQHYRSLQNKLGIVTALESLAAIFEAEHYFDRATLLLAFTAQQRSVLGSPLNPIEQAAIDQLIDRARAELHSAFDQTWQHSAALTLDQALELL